MIIFCPIMSFRHEDDDGIYCRTDECAFWDKKRGQCCIKTMTLAAAKSSGKTGSTTQASYCQTNAVSDIHLKPPAIDNSYIQF